MEQAHIYIYGIIDGYQDDNASEWGYVNLKDVKNQIDAQKGAKEIVVHIHSEGGCVDEGFAIHDFLKAQGKPITTQAEGVCASIATVIFLAGEKRIMSNNSYFFIHNPWGFAGGESGDIQKHADDLKLIEDRISGLYEQHSTMSKDDALQYMKEGKSFTAPEAYDLGFANTPSSEIKAVARIRKNNTKMSKEKNPLTKEEATSLFSDIEERLKKALNLGKPKAVALVVQDANGTELDFPDLGDEDSPSVGDKATVDGSDATGEYVMPSGETYVFEAGELKEIKPEEESEGDDEEMVALKEEVQNLKAENSSLKKDNDDLNKTIKKQNKNIKKISDEVVSLKKSVSSGFNYSPDQNPKKDEGSGGGKRRSLFKKKD